MKSQYKCFFVLHLFRRKGKKISQKFKTAKSQAGRFPDYKGESVPALVSEAPSDLSSLALSLTKDISGNDQAESRDMAEAELELDSSPLEVLSEASVGALGVAFCCGGQEAVSNVKMELLHSDEAEKSSVKSQTAGTNVNNV